VKQLISAKKTFEKKFLFPADGVGEFNLKIYVRSNGYLGLDHETDVKFKVQDRGERKKYEIHPEDLAIKKEPTFFEQLTQGVKGNEADSDEELEEEEKQTEAANQNNTRREHEIPRNKPKTE